MSGEEFRLHVFHLQLVTDYYSIKNTKTNKYHRNVHEIENKRE